MFEEAVGAAYTLKSEVNTADAQILKREKNGKQTRIGSREPEKANDYRARNQENNEQQHKTAVTGS